MSARHRRTLAALTGLLLVVAWILCSAPPASAGGPTSVIIVKPDTGRAAALHTNDPRYQRLVDAVRAYEPPVGESARPAAVTGCELCEIRLTWLVHDVTVWRIDRIHLTAADGIWLESVADESLSGDLLERQTAWLRPRDQGALAELLAGLGVAGSDSEGATPATAVSNATTPRIGVVALAAGVGGLVAGLAIGWYGQRRTQRRQREPRMSLSG